MCTPNKTVVCGVSKAANIMNMCEYMRVHVADKISEHGVWNIEISFHDTIDTSISRNCVLRVRA